MRADAVQHRGLAVGGAEGDQLAAEELERQRRFGGQLIGAGDHEPAARIGELVGILDRGGLCRHGDLL
jgi:hypothetical protein